MAKRTRITNTKQEPTKAEKTKRNAARVYQELKEGISCEEAKNLFIGSQELKGNSQYTIKHYKRTFKKLEQFIEAYFQKKIEIDGLSVNIYKETDETTTFKNLNVRFFESDTNVIFFRKWLEAQNINIQTVNSYLRDLRAWGNWLQNEDYIDCFKCPVKEKNPEIKNVYTESELRKLMKKPPIENFSEFRSYCVVSVLLNTGMRLQSLINIRLRDVNLDEGYINVNVSKTNAVRPLGIITRTRNDLEEWMNYWRYDKGALESDYLFCNEYGEQISDRGMQKAIRLYNKSRGVEKTSIHLFRHTFTKNWLQSGGDMATLSNVLMHKDIQMAMRYQNFYAADVKKEILEHSTISQLKQTSGETMKRRQRRKKE